MGLLGRKDSIGFEERRQQLEHNEPLIGAGYTLCLTVQLGGLRKRTPITILELTTGSVTGWFHLDETLNFFAGRVGVLESWNGSPNDLFLSTRQGAGAGSLASAALSGVSIEQVALLQPSGEGMEIVLLLGLDELQRIETWLKELPKD